MGEGVDDLVDYSLDSGRAVLRESSELPSSPSQITPTTDWNLQHCAVRDFQSVATGRLQLANGVSMHVDAC